MHGGLRRSYISLSGVACRTAGVYGYLLPRHVPSIMKETLRCPRNDPSGVKDSSGLSELRLDEGR